MKNSTKCNICSKFFHPGCANKVKRCCDAEFPSIADSNGGDISPITDIKNISSESSHQELLLKIIHELEAKNLLLIENNSLLKYKISTLENEIQRKNVQINNLNNKKNINKKDKNSDNKHVAHGISHSSTEQPMIVCTVTEAPNNSTDNGIPSTLVPDASTSTAHKNPSNYQNFGYDSVVKMNKTVNENNSSDVSGVPVSSSKRATTISSTDKRKNDTGWNIVSHKRSHRKRLPLIVGSYSGDSPVEGIDKFKAFHVSNLKPETKEIDLQNFLLKSFSNVKCEQLKSKYPESYASFKVLIPDSECEKVRDGSNWPSKATVHRFFQSRKVDRPPE